MRRLLLLAATLAFSCGVACSESQARLNVRNAVEKGNEAWIEAQRTLDPIPLRIWFRDQALQDFAEDLALSRASNSVALLDPPTIVFERVSIDAQTLEATVQTLETWQYSAHRLGSGECLFRAGPNSTRVNYHLRRDGPRWQVVSMTSEAQGARAPKRPCEGPGPQPK